MEWWRTGVMLSGQHRITPLLHHSVRLQSSTRICTASTICSPLDMALMITAV